MNDTLAKGVPMFTFLPHPTRLPLFAAFAASALVRASCGSLETSSPLPERS